MNQRLGPIIGRDVDKQDIYKVESILDFYVLQSQ